MTEVMNEKQPATARFVALHERFQAASIEPAWLVQRRRAAAERLVEMGFPTTRDEAWKYTRVGPIVDRDWELPGVEIGVAGTEIERFTTWEDDAYRLVFVDGVYDAEHSRLDDLPEGLIVAAHSTLLREQPDLLEEIEGRHVEHAIDGFKVLNAALAADGAFVRVPRGLKLERPIHLLFVASGRAEVMSNPRNLIDVGDEAKAFVVERYVGLESGCYFTNAHTEVYVGCNAEVEHDKIQRESEDAFHIADLEVHIERDGRFSSTAISVGAKIGRHEVQQVQGGPNTCCTLNGLYIVDGDRVSDNVVVAHHSRDHGRSEQLYKGILDDRGLGIFNGSIIADEGTKGTDAHQTNKNLLLAEGAVAETRPQLEIYADDIACSHGATVGQLDPESVFYMLSRGIDEKTARAMLTHGFAADVIDRVGSAETRKRIEAYLAQRVSWAGVKVKEED